MAARKHNPSLILPQPGDPLVLPDGRVITEEPVSIPVDTGKINPESRRSASPTDFRAYTKRGLKELPTTKTMWNACAVVFAYTIFGISDLEICDQLGIAHGELLRLRAHRAYHELFESALSEFINTNSELLHSRIAGYAHKAIDTEVHLMDESEMDTVRLAASKDILDRAMKVDPNKQNNQQNEFKITITKPGDEVNVTLEVNGTQLNLEDGEL